MSATRVVQFMARGVMASWEIEREAQELSPDHGAGGSKGKVEERSAEVKRRALIHIYMIGQLI